MIEDWVHRWRDGDEVAAELIYNHFRLRLFRLAFGLLGDAADAEDIMQEVLKYALLNIERYDPKRANLGTWLHKITVNRVRDKQRKSFAWFGLLNRFLQQRELVAPSSSEDEILREQVNLTLLNAVQSLPDLQREVVVLRYWGGHTFPEIAEIIGKSEGTAKSRLRLAHKQLRGSIAIRNEIGDIE